MQRNKAVFILLLSQGLLGCQQSADAPNAQTSSRNEISTISLGQSAATVPVSEDRAGTIYRQEITSSIGDTVVFQVFEPSQLEAGQSYPLVLHGHGYGGSRFTQPNGFTQRLMDAGYYVISIDQRGFGESSGTVRIMSPDQEGQNLIAILDWAEHLQGLARRANGEMYVGAFGSSYGGMYQMLLAAVDPKHRLRVIAPDIPPHDISYALNPNNVPKSGWGLALMTGGEVPLLAAAQNQDPVGFLEAMGIFLQRGEQRQDLAIYEILLNAAVTNRFSEAGVNFMRYHSMRYFCDGVAPLAQDFIVATPDPMAVPPDALPPIDALFTQGMPDTLFNFNDGVNNYECFQGFGGDVRLLTHQSGHILPVSLDTLGLEDPIDPFYQALTIPEYQENGGSRSCGSMNLNDVQFAWFEEKLRGQTGAVDAALITEHAVCLSLAEGDAVSVNEVKRGGQSFAIDAATPQFNSLNGVVGSLLGTQAREALAATIPLYTAPAGGQVIAGIPTLDVTISGLSGLEFVDCPIAQISTGCDPIFFLAIGHRPSGQSRWEALDDQITPMRGFGPQQLEMNGIAERLAEGDELALLIYAYHLQFPVTASRDLLVPAAHFQGDIQLPILLPSDIVADNL